MRLSLISVQGNGFVDTGHTELNLLVDYGDMIHNLICKNFKQQFGKTLYICICCVKKRSHGCMQQHSALSVCVAGMVRIIIISGRSRRSSSRSSISISSSSSSSSRGRSSRSNSSSTLYIPSHVLLEFLIFLFHQYLF